MEIDLYGKKYFIPNEVLNIANSLKKAGFEAYLVGGCVRDLFLHKKPKDWDITTNAKPEQIQNIFNDNSHYDNNFGTVGIVNRESDDETVKIIEVTPFRTEGIYSDKRRPDDITFANKLEDDLKRRDFTMNALALNIKDTSGEIIDLYNGKKDILNKLIRTVGSADERFNEDALRMLRAIRFVSELGFKLSPETESSIKKNSNLLSYISQERIRDEFTKIIMSDNPSFGLETAHKCNLLILIVPELVNSIGVEQKGVHIYDVWQHLLKSLQHSADKKWPLEIRLASLFHDIAKPQTKRFSHETNQWTFYGHEVVGSRETEKILRRLRFPVKTIEKVVKLVRWHMFFSDTEQISLSAVRRMINNVGKENIWDLMNVRVCDRIGTGRPKENPYRLRKYHAMIEEALRDPLSVGMLKIDGNQIIEVTHETPGPKIGRILYALLNEVLDNPKLNNYEYLSTRAKEICKMDENELIRLSDEGKGAVKSKENEEIDKIKDKFHVK